jgi:hypothetical protein
MSTMKNHHFQLLGVLLIFASLAFAQTGAEKKQTKATDHQGHQGHEGHSGHVIAKPEAIQWKPFLGKAEIAVISGDPQKEGAPFVLRIKQPDGMKVPPHWHPVDEHLTVLQGIFVIGMGEKFDIAAGEELHVGAYASMPKRTPHFAMAKGETIVQVHGIGPFAVTFVNPADDPRKKQ